jgi:hypothetical protein
MHYSTVRELTRVATFDTERAWLEAVRGKNLREIEAAVAGRRRGDLPTDPPDPELRKRVVRFELSPQVFALLRQATAVLSKERGERIDDDDLVESLCRRVLDGVAAASSARPSYQIAITVCEHCKRGWQAGAGRDIEISSAAIERARCDAEEIGSLAAERPERTKSTIPPRIRKQVLARDKGCTVPGCRSANNVDIHHIKLRKDGGGHQPWNLTTLCSGHHQRLHDGLLSMEGRAPDQLVFHTAEPAVDHIETALVEDDARQALVGLGLKPSEASAAVATARPHVGESPKLEVLIREALRRCEKSCVT